MRLLDDIVNGTVGFIVEAISLMILFIVLLLYLFIFTYPAFWL